MENKENEEMYDLAYHLLFEEKKSLEETVQVLEEKGMEKEKAVIVVAMMDHEINGARREKAKNDMLYGALWCIGGIVATMADFGFIFWGAILFGGIQFFVGLSNS